MSNSRPLKITGLTKALKQVETILEKGMHLLKDQMVSLYVIMSFDIVHQPENELYVP